MTRIRYRESSGGTTLLGCFFYLSLLSLMAWLCKAMFEYSLWCLIGKDIPWYGDLAGGVVCNAFILPVALACWILRLCGIDAPFIHV